MKTIEESLRELIAFSEKQRASEMRRLKAEGKLKKDVKVDAYTTVINQLSSILSRKADEQQNEPRDPEPE